MSFYLTLPSNASMDLFPNNVVSNYTTKLQQPITLEGSWVVGISKLHFRNSITSYIGYIEFHFQNQITKIDIEVEEGAKLSDIFLKIQNVISSFKTQTAAIHNGINPITINVDKNDDVVKIQIEVMEGITYRFFGLITTLINIDHSQEFNSNRKFERIFNEKTFYKNDNLYIYCDCIEDQFVGDTKAQLLDTLSITESKNHSITIHNTNVDYVNVCKSYIDTINIAIKDSKGENIHFQNLSNAILKLHFKPKKYE